MKFLDLSGREVVVDVRPSSHPMKEESRSKFQQEVGRLLREKFSRDIILEEWKLPNTVLYLDFFIPHRHLIVEADGEGHQKYVSKFHGNRAKNMFASGKLKDLRKDEWAQMNNLRMIRVKSIQEMEDLLNTL